MEMQAAPRPAKRSKPESTSDSSPGASGEEEDGVDRISSLPDAILGEIISLLPTKDGARTRILATWWRHLWLSAPLNLDDVLGMSPVDVFRILSAHQGPGRRFRFPAHKLQSHSSNVDAWLQSRALDNLQEIDYFWDPLDAPEPLRYFWDPLDAPEPLSPPPASTFRSSRCLCVATLSQCHLSDDIAQALQFPKLKKLSLYRVSVSEDSLHSIIAASPVLECLLLSSIFGVHRVKINSASLTSIGVGACVGNAGAFLEEFIVEDAPCLKRILYHREPQRTMRLKVSVISAPNLETLGCLNYSDDSSRLTLGSMIIEPCNKFRIINSTTSACTVKILAVNTFILSLDEIIDFMRCFPCLEKLYIQSSYKGRDSNCWRRKHRNLIKCIDIHLKTVVLNNYRGKKSQINFATFFVLNAKMLESMTFECQRDSVTDRFLAEQHELLQLEKRASRCARVYFTTDRCEHEFMHINHAHDLSKTDPFKCEERGVGVCASFE